jgi:hypothetical protein
MSDDSTPSADALGKHFNMEVATVPVSCTACDPTMVRPWDGKRHIARGFSEPYVVRLAPDEEPPAVCARCGAPDSFAPMVEGPEP